MPLDPLHRRAALIATAVTVPLVVVLAVVIGNVTGTNSHPTPAKADPTTVLTYAAPPQVTAQAAACTKLLARLPPALGTLNQRVVTTTPSTPFVVAWGSPPVVVRCGVDRPKDLTEGSSTEFYSISGTGAATTGPAFDVTYDKAADAQVYTTVDRAAYVSVSIPRTYSAGPLPTLSDAIAAAMPRVCDPNGAAPIATRCTRRK